jgi:glycosyltransferase involved in cell wall biosynthesis
MRIGIIGRLDQPGGVQSVILSLIKGLNRAGIIPDVLWDKAPNREIIEEKKLLANYMPVKFRVPTSFLDKMPITARYISRAANVISDQQISIKYDFLYIFYNGFLVKNDVRHIRYLSGPPLLPQLESFSPGIRGIPFRILRKIYKGFFSEQFPVYEYHRDSRYVINSLYTAQLFEEAHGVKLPVVYPPIDVSGFHYSQADLSSRYFTTFFSRFTRYKRPEMVLLLAKHHPDMQFLLMGGVKQDAKAYFDSLVKHVSDEKITNVRFINTPTGEAVKNGLSQTRFYIFPAVNEHFGMATVEAIASGAIPFVHDSGGQREIVPDERLRFTEKTFLTKFNTLINLPSNELERIRQKLNEHIQQYAEDIFIDKMLSLSELSSESEMNDEPEKTPLH